MEFSDVIAQRRSVRHFRNDRFIGDETINELLLAGISAPTAGNIQPWRFTVVRTFIEREKLVEALGQKWILTAPVVIVVSVDSRQCAARYGDRGDSLYAIQDSAAAVENILLSAVDHGLSACWVGAFDATAVKKALDMRDNHFPVAILPVGYSAESSSRPARRSIEDVTTWL